MLGKKDERLTVFHFLYINPNIAKKVLREAGCTCDVPDLAFRANVGPRCRKCNTISKTISELRKEYDLK